MQSDNELIDFKIQTRTVEYGDKRSFIEYRIAMSSRGRMVGTEEGPRRVFTTRNAAYSHGRVRIAEMRKHRLYVVKVTAKHIRDGEGRNCHSCAISQALWHNQERMGLPKREYQFEASTYACFADPRGLVISKVFGSEERVIEADELPEIVSAGKYFDSMIEWTMSFDNWDDSRHMSLTEWREKNGYNDGERPYRPGPCSFVLDMDAFKSTTEAQPR